MHDRVGKVLLSINVSALTCIDEYKWPVYTVVILTVMHNDCSVCIILQIFSAQPVLPVLNIIVLCSRIFLHGLHAYSKIIVLMVSPCCIQETSAKRCRQVPRTACSVTDSYAGCICGGYWSDRKQKWVHHCGCVPSLPHPGGLDVDGSRSTTPLSETGHRVYEHYLEIPHRCVCYLLGWVSITVCVVLLFTFPCINLCI